MRKFLKALALSALIAVCAISAAACNRGVKLVDFPESKTEEVELGSTYTISLKEVKDENGNTYRVSASVKTKAGGNVSVFESKFDITDIEGYVITYTAKINDKKEQTSVVTLNVVDHGKPAISISKPSTGEVGTPYTLPGIEVSDLSGQIVEKTVEVYFVDGDTETKVEDLTESEGTYTFTPEQAGYYRIKVSATDKSGNSETVTADFTVDEKIAEGTIFDPAILSALTQIKTSTSCPMEVKAGDPTAAYTGDYVSFTSTEAIWHNIYLTPKFELETYEKYDLVEVWLYADAADGTEVGFSFFNNISYNYRFMSDTWTKITIDMEDFVTEMGKNNAIFLPFNTNNPNSTNHVSLTELRLGGVFAKYTVNYTVGEENLNIEAGAEETEVALTVSSDRETVPAFTLTLTKDNQVIQPSKTEGNVYTYVLGAGSYEYKVVSTDEMYRGETTGTFIVDYATKIELPAAENAVAGVAYDIPEATVYVNEEATSEKATVTASFTAKYTNEKTSGIAVKGYVAPSSGIIEVVYTYEGAISKSMTITVERGAVSQNHALDFTSSDVLENIQVAGGNNILTYVSEGDGAPYVSWTIKDNAKANWQMFKVAASVSDEVLEQYDYVKVKAMALSDDGVYRWRALMCSDQYIAGDTAWDAPTRLALNEWGYIYIPMSAFISGGNGFDKKCFVSVTFNSPKDGNADNVKEVRFADFELIKAAEGEIVADKLSYTPQENPSFTVSVTPELGYKVKIRKDGATVATLEQIDGKYVWECAKTAGTYEAVIVLTENGYKLDGDYAMTFYVVDEVTSTQALDFSSADVLNRLSVGAGNVLTYVSEGEGAPYVSWSIENNAKKTWQTVKVESELTEGELAAYAYVKVRVMAISENGTYKWRPFLCSDKLILGEDKNPADDYQSENRLALNEWHDVYVPMETFLTYGNGFDKKYFFSVSFNAEKDGNADGVQEVRFADFELIKAAEGEIVADKIIYTAQENPSFTVSVTPELGYKVEIRQNGETIATLEQIDGKYVWEGNKAEGKYEAVIVLTENGYKLDGDFSVAVYFSEIVDANVIFDPTAENMAAQIASGTTFSMEVKPGDPDAAYSGDYVSFTTTTTGSKWHNIGLTAKSALETYSIYDVVEIWLYADAADGTEVSFSFFNNLTYNYRFMSDTWTKITIDMDDFIAQMSVNSAKFLPFNTNNPSSTNHASLTELRLGAIYAK